MFLGLRSIIYPSNNLDTDKAFWTQVTGKKPYFDQPYYVGFNINGSELGLDPNAAKESITEPVTYWKVNDTKEAVTSLTAAGATIVSEPADIGGGIFMARLKDKSGNMFGVIDGPK